MEDSWAPYVGGTLGLGIGGSLIVAGLATQGIGLLVAVGALVGLIGLSLLTRQAAGLADEQHA